jgi:hypothetical protein
MLHVSWFATVVPHKWVVSVLPVAFVFVKRLMS